MRVQVVATIETWREMAKLAFPAMGALWVFYGVTLVGLFKQLQDPGRLLDWSIAGRRGVWAAIVSFLIINLLAVIGMQEFFFQAAGQVGVTPDYAGGRWVLVGLHAVIDVGASVAALTALQLTRQSQLQIRR